MSGYRMDFDTPGDLLKAHAETLRRRAGILRADITEKTNEIKEYEKAACEYERLAAKFEAAAAEKMEKSDDAE